MKKTSFVLITFIMMILISPVFIFIAQIPGNDPKLPESYPSQTQLENAATYLISMYNPTIGLIANSEDTGLNPTNNSVPHTNTYWVYSDNLWSGYALQSFNREIAENITDNVQQFIVEYGWPLLFEVAIGVQIPTPIHNGKDIVVYDDFVNGTRIQVLLDRHQPQDNPSIFDDADEYADLCFYMTINFWIKGDTTKSEQWFRSGEALWNYTTNNGFYDKATRKIGRYQNYKLGLFLFTQRATGFKSNIAEYVEATAWSYQKNDSGGITTQSGLNGSFNGTANAEATSALLLAYNYELIHSFHSTTG